MINAFNSINQKMVGESDVQKQQTPKILENSFNFVKKMISEADV